MEKGCLNKTTFDTKEQAMKVGRHYGLRTYKCRFTAGHWHLTSKGSKGKAPKIYDKEDNVQPTKYPTNCKISDMS